jgi:hypothetical protein
MGCGDIFQPRRWNQRYCGTPECRRELRRWQSAKRQQRRRSRPEVRQQHAAAERQRRARRREVGQGSPPPAPKGPESDGAWSRSKKISGPFCDRPGCYEPRRPAARSPARYCGDGCAQDIRRVLDRERKWLRRNTPAGRLKRRLERERQRRRRCSASGDPSGLAAGSPQCGSDAVLNYRDREARGLSCHGTFPEDPADDRKEAAPARPRPPPS